MRWWPSATKRTCPGWLTARPYAHRGLHGGGIVENSLAAFEAAIAMDFGIELDVRPSRCGTPFVFHDAALDRLCGCLGRLSDLDAREVAGLSLVPDGGPVPSLSQVLDLVAGRTPILVEVKSDGPLDAQFCLKLRHLLHGRSNVAVMSFDPRVMRWFHSHLSGIPLGLVVTEEGEGKIRGTVRRNLVICLARPDFLAYDIRSLPSRFAAAQRGRRPVLSWTVRTDKQARIAHEHADQIIHEWPGAQ